MEKGLQHVGVFCTRTADRLCSSTLNPLILSGPNYVQCNQMNNPDDW